MARLVSRGGLLAALVVAGYPAIALAQNASVPLRINCGGWGSDFTDDAGKTWVVDRYYTGGYNTYSPVFPPLNRFALYSTMRQQTTGDVVYRIPLANANYQVTLHFIEMQYNSVGQRVFNVLAQGATALPNFDIRANAGALATPVVKPLPSAVAVTNGILELIFRGVVGPATIAGIEIEADNSTPVLSVSPASLTFASFAGVNPATQNLSITNTGGGTLNWTAVSSQPWLTVTPSGAAPGTATATVNVAGLAAGPYSASITVSSAGANGSPKTIPVSLTLTPPPVISAAPASLTYTATQGGANPVAQVVNITNTGGGTLNWTATSNQTWLTLTPSANSVSAAVSITGLAPNTYNATITISASGATNTPQTIPVSLTVNPAPPTINASPGSLTFSGVQGGANPVAQVVSITNSGGGTLNWTAVSNQPWLTLTPSANSVSAAVSLTGLTPSTYNATITISASGATNTPQTIPVTLTVTAPPTINAAPASLTFTGTQGGANPAAQVVNITNSGGGTLNWTAVSNQPWLTLTPSANSVSAAVSLAGLAPNTYNATITISATGATNTPKTIPVTLTVNPAPPTISASPTPLTFSGVQGGANPAAQVVNISNTGGGTLSWTAVSNQAWLTLTPSANSVSAAVSLTGLTPNTYNATITISAAGATNTPQTIPVSLTVLGPPSLTVSPLTMAFSTTQGGSAPAAQNLSIGNSGSGTVSWTAVSNAAWLTVTASGTAPSTAAVNVSPTGLTAGTYNGQITVTATGAQNSPQTVAVTLTVSSQPTFQTLRINPGGWGVDWVDAAGKTWVADRNWTGGYNFYSAFGSPFSAMLSTARMQIQASTDLRYQIPVPNGDYQVTLHFVELQTSTVGARKFHVLQNGATVLSNLDVRSEAGFAVELVKVLPTVTVTGGIVDLIFRAVAGQAMVSGIEIAQAAPVVVPPAIGVSPASLTFTGVSPAPQTVNITNSGGGTLTWAAASNQPWLTLTPSGASVSAAVSTAGLAPGTYNATITISATGASNTPQTVPVSLTVPSPVINFSPSSLSFTGTQGGANPAAQVLSITNAGGGTLSWTATSNQAWLTLTPGANSVSAAVSLTGLTANTYNATITIAAVGATNTPQTVPVTLTVSAAPPTISFSPAALTFSGVSPAAQTVSVSNSGGGTLNWTATSNQPWLTLTPSANSVSAAVSTAGLAPNTYNATITIAATGATNTPQTIPVTLTVPAPAINFSPSSLSFTGTQGGANPAAQVLNVTNSGGGTLTWTAVSNQPWLTLTPSANSVSAAISLTGLTANTYSATITINAAGATNTPQTVPVTLTVNAAPPTISFSPASLTFSGVSPAAQTVNVSNSGGGTLNWTATSNQPWLTLTPSANSVSAAVSTAGLAPDTYNATITIAATGATNTPQTIPVTLTVPAPTINFSPASLTFTGVSPAPQTVNITNSGGGTLNWTATSNQPWLTLTPSANSVSAAVSTAGLAPNTYNATITIAATGATNTPQTVAVTLTVPSPTINFSPGSLTFTGTQGGADPVAQVLGITNLGGGTLNWTATSNQPWLTLTPSANSVSAAVSLTGLTANTYNATITISAAGATNTPQTVPITFTVNAAPPTIGFSPSSLTFAGNQGGANPAAQVLNVTNSGGGTLNWTATSNQPWLTLTPSANSVSAAVSLTGLASNTYNAAITISATGATNTPQTIPVTLTVAQGPILSATPTSLSFSGEAGAAAPTAQSISVTTAGSGTLTWTAASNQPWLTLTTGANSISAAVSTTGLTPNTYTGAITITATGAAGSPQSIPVSLTVTAPPTLTTAPASLTFNGVEGGANPLAQSISVTNSGGGTLTWTAVSNQPWLVLTPAANSVSAAVILTGLTAGTYNATVTVTATGAQGSPKTIPVTLTVDPPPSLTAAPISLTFTGTQGGSNPAAQTINVANGGGGTLTWTAVSNQPWLTLTSGANSISAAVSLTGLAPNTYNATITVAAPGAQGSPKTIPVTLTVDPPPTLTVAPTSLTFTATQGGANPAAQNSDVTNSGSGTLNWTATSNQPWLTLTSSANAISAAVNIAGLAANTYNATITVTAPGAQGSPKTIPVTLTVAQGPTLSLTPTTLSFTAVQGGANPATQSIAITNPGTGTVDWTAVADQPWLAVTPSGTAPSTLVATVTTGALTPATYNATITVTAPGAAGSPKTIPISFVVSPPPTLSVAPASLTYSGVQGGTNPAAQTLSVTNSGSGTLTWIAASDQPWLTLTPSANSVSAAVSLAGLAPNTYNATITVTATGAQGSPKTIPVTLTVTAPPSISLAPTTLTFTAVDGDPDPAAQSIAISNGGGGTLTWTAASNQSWLTLAPTSGSGPGPVSATASIAGRTSGTYNAVITITATGASNTPQTVPVTLTVQPRPPTLTRSPATLTFTATQGGSNPVAQNISITNTGGGTLNWTATSDQPWLTLGAPSGAAPSTLAANVSINGLQPGNYTATVTISAAGATGSPQTVAVSLTVQPQPSITLSVNSLSFGGLEGAANPPAQTVTVNTTGATFNWTAASDQPWLTLTPTSGSTPGSVSVRPNIGSMTGGAYSANVTFTAPGALGSPKTLPVQFVITPNPPAPNVTPTSLSYSIPVGGGNPAGQTISITNQGAGSFTWTATANQSWLTVTPASGAAPATPSISVNSTGLTAGTYSGAVTVLTSASSTPIVVNVSFSVTALPPFTPIRLNSGGWGEVVTEEGKAWAIDRYYINGYNVYAAQSVNGAFSAVYSTARNGAFGGDVTYRVPVPSGTYQVTLRFIETQVNNPGQRVFNILLNGAVAVQNFDILTQTQKFTPLVKTLPPVVVSGTQLEVRLQSVTNEATLSALEIEQPSYTDPPGATLSVTPASLSFVAQAGTNPASQALSISNAGVGTLNWTASSNQPWLTLSTGAGSGAANITISANTTGLTPGAYNATLTITATGAIGSPKTIPVTLAVGSPPAVLSATPSSLSFTGTAGGANPASQSIQVSNTGGGTLSWSAASNQPWLTVSPASGSGNAFVSASVALAGLAPGTYSGAVTISATGAQGSPKTLSVSLVVAAAPPVLSAGPSSLAFTATQGAAAPAAQAIAISNTGGGTLSWTATSNQPWLTVSPASGSAPANLAVNASHATLTPGTYTAAVTVTAAGVQGSPQVIPISFTVLAAQPALDVTPASLSFTAMQGQSNPAAQSLSVANLALGALGWTATSDQPWLTISPASGATPSAISVSAALGTLAPGTYTGNVDVTAAGATGSPKRIPVAFTVNAPAPEITTAPTGLSFTATQGGTAPAQQSISITNTGTGTLNWTATANQTWLIVTPSGTAPSTLAAQVAPGSLTAGTYNATITITSAGAVGSPKTIPVSFVVNPAPPTLSVAPVSLTFTAFEGGAAPASQSLNLSNPGSGSLTFTASSNQAWLAVSPTSGPIPTAVTVSVSPTGLTAGTYTASITVTSAGAAGSPATIPVTFTVSTPPTLSVSTSALTFAGAQGAANPPAQTVDITNAGTGSLNWTASSAQSWIVLSPASGSAPATLSVTANTTGLTPGSYNGTIVVTAASAAGSPKVINVALTVSAPPVNLSLTPTSISFLGSEGGSTPPAQTITVASSGAALTWTASTTSPWIVVGPSTGSTPATFSISANLAGLTQGQYTGTVAIAAPGAQNSPQSVGVTLTVGAQANITLTPSNLSYSIAESGPNPAAQTVSIAIQSASPVAWTAYSTQPWLTVSPNSGTGNGVLTVGILAAGLQAGAHAGAIEIATPGTAGPVRTVSVSLSAAIPAPQITTAASLSAQVTAGASSGPRTVAIGNSGGGTLSWTATSSQPWLVLSQAAGSVPSSTRPGVAWNPPPVAGSPTILPTGATGGTTLSNGIVLPAQWPPTRARTQDYQVPSYLVSPPGLIGIDNGRQLFVDDFLIESTTLGRTRYMPRMHPGNPILAPAANQTIAIPYSDGVWFDPADSKFKLFYFGPSAYQVYLTESTDGKTFSLGVPVFNIGSGRDAATVLLDLKETNPARRWKAFAYYPVNGGTALLVYFSPDGRNWTQQNFTAPSDSDRTTVWFDPFRNVFVDSNRYRTLLPAAGGRPGYNARARTYAESTDLLTWRNGGADIDQRFWTGPDYRDPLFYADRASTYPELYNLDAAPYESLLVGLFSFYHPGPDNVTFNAGPDLLEIEEGFSRDGFQWWRPNRAHGEGRAFIASANYTGPWNGYNTQSAGGGFLVVGDELWFYFSGREGHKGNDGRMSTGLATLRRDGFVSLDAGAQEGSLTTRKVRFTGRYLFVNVDNPGGVLRRRSSMTRER
ncbi:MAG: malectin domain-containing carbohydrate-binding protein [Bryobacteraceae bacterium]